MDPDQALSRIHIAVADYRQAMREGLVEAAHTKHDELVEHFEALDGWLSKGGFLPEAWNQKRS